MKELSFEELEKLIEEKKHDRTWSRVVGFYYKLTGEEHLTKPEKWRVLNSLVKALMKRGYLLSNEVILKLLR